MTGYYLPAQSLIEYLGQTVSECCLDQSCCRSHDTGLLWLALEKKETNKQMKEISNETKLLVIKEF